MIRRNEDCFCGSQKKYKKCCGSVNTPPLNGLIYKIKKVNFCISPNDEVPRVNVEGFLYNKNFKSNFKTILMPIKDGQWGLNEIYWEKEMPIFVNKKNLTQQILNTMANEYLKTINMWAGEQMEKGAQIYFNEILAPKEAEIKMPISFRLGMLNIPSQDWNDMWSLIYARIKLDPYFKVHGFEKDEVLKAVKNLEKIFPAEWVRAKYNLASTTNNPAGMGDEFQGKEKYWFPAYHLARTAQGAICIDPGWNYLVEIGLSISELENFKEAKKLIGELASNPGTQHHFCLAAELYKRGYLIGLEPETGNGNATNDLLVSINKNQYAIEVKEFSSNNPVKRLIKELKDKAKKTPGTPNNAIIFHIVLIGNKEDYCLKKKEDSFSKQIDYIFLNIPPQISAIVVGVRLIDSSGGRIKRNISKIIINPNAIISSDIKDLSELFKSNYKNIIFPAFELGTYFYFGNLDKDKLGIKDVKNLTEEDKRKIEEEMRKNI